MVEQAYRRPEGLVFDSVYFLNPFRLRLKLLRMNDGTTPVRDFFSSVGREKYQDNAIPIALIDLTCDTLLPDRLILKLKHESYVKFE